MIRALLAAFAAASLLLAASDEQQIRKVLDDQTAAWNRGDIRVFLEGYDHAPDLTFVSKNVVKGYDGVLDRYLKNYPDKAAMGTLRFSDLEIRVLDASYASVIGRFHLDRAQNAGGEAQGLFTLLFRKTSSGWKIILDHTS
ncbi:MAG: nuclear transport factor 2 family protein [Acidobacteriaceae bacterium]|nr:nuclear transport factor 2 family protein [Acidobacteriaceae bacterium]